MSDAKEFKLEVQIQQANIESTQQVEGKDFAEILQKLGRTLDELKLKQPIRLDHLEIKSNNKGVVK